MDEPVQDATREREHILDAIESGMCDRLDVYTVHTIDEYTVEYRVQTNKRVTTCFQITFV